MVDAPQHVPSERLGPIDYIVIEFPDGKVTGAGFRRIVELSDAARILVLDIEFLSKGADGHVVTTPAHDLGEIDGVDMAFFDGAATYLLDDDDIHEIGDAMSPGSVAVIVIYEELSMISALVAWEGEGAVLLAEGPIEVDALVAAIDETEGH
jgi:hypothetical protein